MAANGDFLEWANVHGNRYGTSRQAVLERISNGQDVLLEIDYQGALQVRQIFPKAILIFILPPSWQELRARLERRGEDSADTIETRIKNAETEMSQAGKFDFVIINELFELALFDLKPSYTHSACATRASRARAATFAATHCLNRTNKHPLLLLPTELPAWPASPLKTASPKSLTASNSYSLQPTAPACSAKAMRHVYKPATSLQ